ncbi:TrmH family RNA methyltransferase [Actinoalloteichus hoggarensis]|uniref:23S rRNA (Uridine(2479)-2'-O)-methyltransferase n=1 Tax=Actinoalloteichus hoggarensis TaxID=1470176 RepID=A0A221VZU8_9PSEU|nr:TrmH family RNA methyltransferase [Actinoalloteichus hoggarensis]ASO19040.1 23S rRNA (uridine(2479)-2'-O)-methyltransferase [Actinoalloteichus hoggarensis]MBB5920276.1 TrmH family RNA methyltransferase [Actinoalloteichus hoggarensis]
MTVRSAKTLRITTRNAAFQQWQALVTNRNKRARLGEFLVQGVRPISIAVRQQWPLRSLLRVSGRLSAWASEILATADVDLVHELSPELMAELGQKEDKPPELIAVAEIAADDLTRIPIRPDMLVVAFDRPTSPGNLGTVIRSADALGACGVLITGHAADLYDPKTIRATTGSFFAMPAVRVAAGEQAAAWVDEVRAGGIELRVIGTSEDGACDIADADLRGPTMLVIGNETTGMSSAWAARCDELVRIPMVGSASSLNAAASASIALYEAARQRRAGAAG